MRRSFAFGILLLTLPLALMTRPAFAEDLKTLKTRFTSIRYTEDSQISAFFWRISGRRLDPVESRGLASNRVDELVERVEALLEMYPSGLKFEILLVPRHVDGPHSTYSHKTGRVTAYLDRLTDGVLAHEIAHAVICAYFVTPPPEKTQEVLAQYVDKHLWELV